MFVFVWILAADSPGNPSQHPKPEQRLLLDKYNPPLNKMATLPPEIILHVVECLIPSSPPVAFSPSHPVTRTLINLTLVSSLTSAIARRLLLKHCLYIDSEERLTKLISLQRKSLIDLTATSPNGLFLAPFPPANLNCPDIARGVSQLLSAISGTLTRLVINLPLRYLYPEDDVHQLRSVLREAFSRLTNLEEFCSMQDELFLNTVSTHIQPEIWPMWPRLRRLALYNACLNSPGFVDELKACSNLTHLVFPRPDGLFAIIPEDQAGFAGLAKLERVTIVNTERGLTRYFEFTEDERVPPGETLMGRLNSAWLANNTSRPSTDNAASDTFCTLVKVPIPPDQDHDYDADIPLCQAWVGTRAIDGTLWDTRGTPFLNW